MARLALYGLLMERTVPCVVGKSALYWQPRSRLLRGQSFAQQFRVHDLFHTPSADHTRKQGQKQLPSPAPNALRAKAKGRREAPSAAPANGSLLAVSC
jgi:hypothetical protein